MFDTRIFMDFDANACTKFTNSGNPEYQSLHIFKPILKYNSRCVISSFELTYLKKNKCFSRLRNAHMFTCLNEQHEKKFFKNKYCFFHCKIHDVTCESPCLIVHPPITKVYQSKIFMPSLK